jgi:hypothetical protein
MAVNRVCAADSFIRDDGDKVFKKEHLVFFVYIYWHEFFYLKAAVITERDKRTKRGRNKDELGRRIGGKL